MKRWADGSAQLPLAKFDMKRRLRETLRTWNKIARSMCVYLYVYACRRRCLIQYSRTWVFCLPIVPTAPNKTSCPPSNRSSLEFKLCFFVHSLCNIMRSESCPSDPDMLEKTWCILFCSRLTKIFSQLHSYDLLKLWKITKCRDLRWTTYFFLLPSDFLF